jgi:hypothetical protein
VKRNSLELLSGPGGWVQARVVWDDNSAGPRSFVRFIQDENGRWEAVGLWVDMPTPDVLRSVPLNRISLAANASYAVSAALSARMSEPVHAPQTAEFYASFDGFVKYEPPIELKRPKGRRLDDTWYSQVADAYVAATGRGLNPRASIAEAAGVSPDVAGRWIHQARKRHLLAATKPGKVTT